MFANAITTLYNINFESNIGAFKKKKETFIRIRKKKILESIIHTMKKCIFKEKKRKEKKENINRS